MTVILPRILCVGSNIESLVTLKGLLEKDVNLVGVLTGKKKKPKRGSDYRDLTSICKKAAIPFLRIADVNSAEAKKFIKSQNVDYIFILGWSQIFDDEVVSLPKHGVLGSHPSLLPYGAGRAPVPWTVLENQKRSAVSIFKVTSEVDAGDVIHQEHFSIPINSNSKAVYELVSTALLRSYQIVYDKLCRGDIKAIEQNIGLRTVRAKRTPVDGLINFNFKAKDIVELIRAAGEPYPGAFTHYFGEKIIIWQAQEVKNYIHKGVSGQILKKSNEGILVQCADKPILLLDYTDENEVQLKTVDFRLGERFGYILDIEYHNLRQEIAAIKRILESNGIS